MNKQNKAAIQAELASIRSKYEIQKSSLPAEAIAIIDLLFGLFNILLISMGVKATSQNSHLPPSRDPHRSRPPRKRQKRKIGGVKGHRGKSLEQVPHPDQVVLHTVSSCQDCGSYLESIPLDHLTRHQVFDLKIKLVVTEHQVEHKRCYCGHPNQGELPAGVSSAPCSYGAGVKAMAVELTQVQFIPLKRASEFFGTKFGIPLSQTSIVNFNQEFYELLKKNWQPQAQEQLLGSEVLNADETGINVNGKNHWIHSLSGPEVVLMVPHKQRGQEAMDEIGLLKNYNQVLCHDFWASYGAYDVIHACCHAHLKRELERCSEEYQQKWAPKMNRLLQGANKLRDKQEGDLTWEQVQRIERRYRQILEEADLECPLQTDRVHQKGRIAQKYPRQLLNRLISHRSWILLFLYDPRVPFTNNQAERDIRMAKVQQKVSGSFRTFEGAERFCLARSYVLSMNRQGKDVAAAIETLFRET